MRRPLFPTMATKRTQYPVTPKPPLFLLAMEGQQEIKEYLDSEAGENNLEIVRKVLNEIIPLKPNKRSGNAKKQRPRKRKG